MVDVLIGVGGTLLGAVVGVGGVLTISRDDRRHAGREDVRRALTVYLGALYPSVSELKELPPKRPESTLARWLTRLERDDVRWLRQRRLSTCSMAIDTVSWPVGWPLPPPSYKSDPYRTSCARRSTAPTTTSSGWANSAPPSCSLNGRRFTTT